MHYRKLCERSWQQCRLRRTGNLCERSEWMWIKSTSLSYRVNLSTVDWFDLRS